MARSSFVAAVTLVACAGPLIRLWAEIRAQTPRAYLLAALLAAAFPLYYRARPGRDEPDIHDRRVDYLVGLSLLGAAGFVLTAVPTRVGIDSWASHADLVAAPVTLAGGVALAFGRRALRSLRTPLILATACLAPLPEAVVRVAANVLAVPALRVVDAVGPNLAGWSAPPSAPSGVFAVHSDGHIVAVSFEGAVTGAAGFLTIAVLAALSLAYPFRSAVRNVALVAGLCSTLAVLRLTLAFVAAAVSDPTAAIGVLGPRADCVVLGLMLVGVRVVAARAAGERDTDSASPPTRRTRVTRRRVAVAVLLLAGASIVGLGMSGAARSSYPYIAVAADLAREAVAGADQEAEEGAGGTDNGGTDGLGLTGSAPNRAQSEPGQPAQASMWRVPLTDSSSGTAAIPVVLDLFTAPDPADPTTLTAAVVGDCYGLTPASPPVPTDLGTGIDGLHSWWVNTAGNRFQTLTWIEPGRSTLWATLLSPASADRSAPIPQMRSGPCTRALGAGTSAAEPTGRVAEPADDRMPAGVAERLYRALAVQVTADAAES